VASTKKNIKPRRHHTQINLNKQKKTKCFSLSCKHLWNPFETSERDLPQTQSEEVTNAKKKEGVAHRRWRRWPGCFGRRRSSPSWRFDVSMGRDKNPTRKRRIHPLAPIGILKSVDPSHLAIHVFRIFFLL
jgi:hypothetical protein